MNLNVLKKDELVTLQDVASRLKVRPSFLYAPSRRKGPDPIPCVKVGKYLRYDLDEVREWLERQQVL